ncbi:MAG TPA: trypsin-like peptidase domain-containing protein [Ktedonobacterales bacterium]|jgi:S1-C subfamily serine protease
MADTHAQPSALSQFSDQLANVVEQAAHSIVTVAARPRQTATGILWKAETETIILTADHVIEREEDINVTLPDKREVKAQLIGRDPSTDLAALRLSGVDLGTENVPAETSESLRVGNLVLAIGRPSSDGPRVSFGAVSSIDGPRRSWQGSEIEGVIYADVTLYPGFSGGPLVNLAGQVVGLNSSQLTRQNSSALPVVTLRRVANALLKHGRVQRGYLGVGTQQAPLPAALAQKAGLTQQTGLLIVTVEAGSPAEQAGLLIGDLLVSLSGQPTTDGATLRAQLGADRLGQSIPAKIIRGGEPRDLSITIAERSER